MEDNTDITETPAPPPAKKSSKVTVIIVAVFACTMAVIFATSMYICISRRSMKNSNRDVSESSKPVVIVTLTTLPYGARTVESAMDNAEMLSSVHMQKKDIPALPTHTHAHARESEGQDSESSLSCFITAEKGRRSKG